MTFPVESGVSVPEGPIHLAMEVRDNELQFFWHSAGSAEWRALGPVLDAGVISDEGGRGEHGSFTGAFAGVFAFDTSGRAKSADFDYVVYQVL